MAFEEWESYQIIEDRQWGEHFRILRYTDKNANPPEFTAFKLNGDQNGLRNQQYVKFNEYEWYENILYYEYAVAGKGQTSPILAKLDPNGVKIYYSRAMDSCTDCTMTWEYDFLFTSTFNWIQGKHQYFQLLEP